MAAAIEEEGEGREEEEGGGGFGDDDAQVGEGERGEGDGVDGEASFVFDVVGKYGHRTDGGEGEILGGACECADVRRHENSTV